VIDGCFHQSATCSTAGLHLRPGNSTPQRRVPSLVARNGAWLLLMLGALTMLPALSIDVSLPGLPVIAHALDASTTLMQWTLSAFVLAFGIGQLILGPLSDRYGRRPVLLSGLALFTFAAAASAFVSDAGMLVALRLLQGFGACAGTVCARAIAQDLSANDRVAGTVRQAVLSAVGTIAPVLAPLAGAAILALFGWRWLYGVLGVIGAVLVVLVALGIRETSPRIASGIREGYARVLRLPRTAGLLLLVAASFFGYFSLITGSPFVVIGQLHAGSAAFAACFAINAVALFIGASLAGRLAQRIGSERLIAGGALLTLVAGAIAWYVDTFAPTLTGFVATWTLVAFGVGFSTPGAFATALAAAQADAGSAAGLLGAGQMLAGALGSALAGLFPGPASAAAGTLALIGGIGVAAGYRLSRPRSGQERERREAPADDPA
jgi:DHA1 family bicyclomycin/chloramphenicol resistance-like MFS transporter